jgi:hypothetical protein
VKVDFSGKIDLTMEIASNVTIFVHMVMDFAYAWWIGGWAHKKP